MKILSSGLALLLVSMIVTVASPGWAADDNQAAVDPSGTWRWEHDEGGETIKDVLKLNIDDDGEVTGTYQGRIGPIDLDEAEVEGDALSCDFEIEFGENTIEVEFEGTIDGDSVTGTVAISGGDESQEFPWVASRSVEDSDVVGSWDIMIELEDGNTLTPTLEVKQDKDSTELVGSYSSLNGDAELNVEEVKVSDNKLTFTVSGEFNGNTLTADYEVAPRGNKFSGTVAYDFNGQTGELDVEGKRQTADDDDDADDDTDDDNDDDDDDDDDEN
jgi:hypothetical protein